MKIALFRHAEKNPDGSRNPQLSATGLRQAEILPQYIQKNLLPTPEKIFSSPKIRACQTFASLSKWLGIPIETSNFLDERTLTESYLEFEQRCRLGLKAIETQAQQNCVYVCSHSDWIDEALKLIPSKSDLKSLELANWSSAQYALFEFNKNLWEYQGSGRLKG